MIRAIAFAAATLAVTVPAIAADTTASKTDVSPVVHAQLTATSGALEARKHLARQGYINISTLEQDSLGRWSGTAVKDGKLSIVAIKLPRIESAGASH